MKKLFISLLVFAGALAATAQPLGNEWINYNQRYYKFPIFESGVYRITYQDFVNAGIPIALVDPDKIQLFAFAEEVPVHIEGIEDGVFNSTDYVEFVAEKNDGRKESVLYESQQFQGNPDYSLFNDTIHYFITVESDQDGLRYTDQDDTNFDDYTPAEYFWRTSRIVYENRYYDQPQLLDQPPLNNPNFRLSLSEFSTGEGWLSSAMTLGNPSITSSINTSGIYRGDNVPNATAQVVVVGVSDMFQPGNDHFVQITYGLEFILSVNYQYDGYRVNTFDFDIPNIHIEDAATPIVSKVANGLGLTRDDQALQHVEITYPHITNFANQTSFEFVYRLNTVESKTRFDLDEVGGMSPRIYTEGPAAQRIVLTPNSQEGSFKCLIANDIGANEFKCVLVSDESVKSISPIVAAANEGYFTAFGQSQVDSAFVIITHESLMAEGLAYANYRQAAHNTVLVDIAELYDQYGYGVEKSGMALRNFSNHILQAWQFAPQHLLLLGKSVRAATIGNLAGTRKNPAYYERSLVPSLGYPPSDNMITAGLGGTTLEPAIRTGRISAKNGDEAMWYLNKLQTFEAQEPNVWMKNAIHFGGGTNTLEQARFANYLSNYETLAQDSSFGAIVSTFLKTSSEPVQLNVSDEISDLIENQGISLMTFFAHAGSEGFDQTIDDPENFDWNGKYPFLLGNGCFSGDYHGVNPSSTSEKYTILNQKGVIGFLASVDLGIEGELNVFSYEFYEQLSILNYGQTVGDHIKKTITEIQAPTVLRKYLCHGMGLQGDPSVVLNSFPLPDLAITEQDIYFTPEEITNEIDSFDVNIVVKNHGRATYQAFAVTLEHQTPEGAPDSVYVQQMLGLLNIDTISFRVPIDPQFGIGLHNFNVLVDVPLYEVPELPGKESSNNQIYGKQLLIANEGLVPIYPYRNAVVDAQNITLKASTGNPLAALKTYRMQVDTTDLFDSPLFQQIEIVQTGGVVEWTPTLNYPDSVVYFWRCAELKTDDLVWRESNFQYIPNRNGWGQAQIFQFEDNNFFGTELNREDRSVDFFTGNISMKNNVIGNSYSFGTNIIVNTTEVEYGGCFTHPAIHIAVFDPITFQAWSTYGANEPEYNDFGNVNAGSGCRQIAEQYFIFWQNNPDQMAALSEMLTSDAIPDGHYVLAYTFRYVYYNGWTPATYAAFNQLGAQLIGAPGAQDLVPFSLFVRKGDPGFVHEVYGNSSTDVLLNSVDVPSNGNLGSLITPKIGPASVWETASWQTFTNDTEEGDNSVIKLIGVNHQGVESYIASGEFDGESNTIDLSTLIDAAEFPYMRLEALHEDIPNATPLQIDRWHVLHQPAPELALNPSLHYVFEAEELQAGEEGFISVAITNVSEIDMDSLLVHYWIEDAGRNRIEIPYERRDSLRKGVSLIDTVRFDTRYLSGKNVLWVEANPKPEGENQYDQSEQVHFNNIMQIPFDVSVDTENPMLDVTFDGIHIINGEIVSPNAMIRIALKDENPFLLMDEPSDTSLFKIFVAEPLGELQRVFFSGNGMENDMVFMPALNEKNRAKIDFTPKLGGDGVYTMLVQANDKSGNQSGSIDYRIEFEVVNQSTITEVLNYPNPFSTSTQFVFTLTGSEIPDEFKIQIMTISGKVVREITQDEFGPIRIGRNFSSYKWDGHDEYGDRLANGVYLYRVFARLNGQNIDVRESGASQYFQKSFGKMVLFR